jgi:hypothetical protein
MVNKLRLVMVNGDLELFIVNSNGSALTQVTNNNDTI